MNIECSSVCGPKKYKMLFMKRLCISMTVCCLAPNESFVELTSLLAVSEQSRPNLQTRPFSAIYDRTIFVENVMRHCCWVDR